MPGFAPSFAIDATWWPERLLAVQAKPRLIDRAAQTAIDFLRVRQVRLPFIARVFDFDLAEAVARIPARTLVLEFTTLEEAHFREQGLRLCALMPNATTASIPVTFLTALERQATAIADMTRKFPEGRQMTQHSDGAHGAIRLQPGYADRANCCRVGTAHRQWRQLRTRMDGSMSRACAAESIFALDIATGAVTVEVGPFAGEADDLLFTPDGDLIWTAFMEGAVRRRYPDGTMRDLATGLPGINSIALTPRWRPAVRGPGVYGRRAMGGRSRRNRAAAFGGRPYRGAQRLPLRSRRDDLRAVMGSGAGGAG